MSGWRSADEQRGQPAGRAVAACLLLVAGIGAGSLGGYEFAQNRAAHAAARRRYRGPRRRSQCATAAGRGPA